MDRQIDLFAQQCVFDLFGKHAFAADALDRRIDKAIAAGFDDCQFDDGIAARFDLAGK
jgi:hypothetical protein